MPATCWGAGSRRRAVTSIESIESHSKTMSSQSSNFRPLDLLGLILSNMLISSML